MERLSGIENTEIAKIPWSRIQPPGFAAFGRIYLRDAVWEDYQSGNPKPETLATIKHEQTHIDRGLRVFARYWLDRHFRFQEELAATREEMKVLRKHAKPFDIDKRARDWSGAWYLWCTKYDTAKQKLEKMWAEIGKKE